jgi:hypothetical protein
METPAPQLKAPSRMPAFVVRLVSTPASAGAAERALRVSAGLFALLVGLLYCVVVFTRVGVGTELSRFAGPFFKGVGPIVLVLNAIALSRSSSRVVASLLFLIVAANAVLSFPAPIPLLLLAVSARLTYLAFVWHRFTTHAPLQGAAT